MISIKIYSTPQGLLLAGCDSELVGKKFCDGKLKLDICKEFYCQEEVDEKTFLIHLRNCAIANLVGKKIVKLAIENGYIDKKCVIKIKGIPHAQYLRMDD